MDKNNLLNALKNGYIEWQRHAVERMMERGILRREIIEALKSGEIIEDYPNDKPYPSALYLGWIKGEPFHVVAAIDSISGWCLIITAYKPDLEHFEPDYKTRRRV